MTFPPVWRRVNHFFLPPVRALLCYSRVKATVQDVCSTRFQRAFPARSEYAVFGPERLEGQKECRNTSYVLVMYKIIKVPVPEISTSSRGHELSNQFGNIYRGGSFLGDFPLPPPTSISSTPYWILSRALTCKPNQLPKCIRLPYPIADDFTYPEEFQLHRKQK